MVSLTIRWKWHHYWGQRTSRLYAAKEMAVEDLVFSPSGESPSLLDKPSFHQVATEPTGLTTSRLLTSCRDRHRQDVKDQVFPPERLSQSETHSWSPVCQISSVWTSASFFHECHHQNQHFLPTIYLSAKNESMNEVIQIKLNQVKLIHVWNQQPTSNSQSSVYASRSCNLQPLKQDCWCFHVDA